MLVDGLLLVETLQGAVVALVETPGPTHREVLPPHLLESQLRRTDRPHQHGSVEDVGIEPFLDITGPPLGLRLALIGQADVGPPVNRFSRFQVDCP